MDGACRDRELIDIRPASQVPPGGSDLTTSRGDVRDDRHTSGELMVD
jgi:hypothetical protein